MTSLADSGPALPAVPGISDEETLGFIPADGLGKPQWRSRLRKAALAATLLAGAAVAAVCLSPFAACEAPSATASQGSDLGAAVGLAERRQVADEKAKAIVQVLNEKPKDEINVLVQRAMQHAGEQALEKRQREVQDQATFNKILASNDNVCTLVNPKAGPNDGVFLGHDLNSIIHMEPFEIGPSQWKITKIGHKTDDTYRVVNLVPGATGDRLVRTGVGKVGLGTKQDPEKWRIYPATPGANPQGLFHIESIGAPAIKGFLTRKGTSDVFLGPKGTPETRWNIVCAPSQFARQAQRRATCAFNVLYATQYLARTSLLIQAAARTCPNSQGLLNKICQVNALVTVASISNLALELSNAASSCAETTNVKALCASAVEALIVSLTTIGAGGIVTATACQPGLTAADLNLPPGASPANLLGYAQTGRRLFLGGGTANFMGQCILDFTQVAWSLGSVGIAITASVRDSCPAAIQGTGILVALSQSACSMDIAAIIYAFSRIALFLALSTIHCTDALNLQALCSGGVTALIAAAAALVVTGDAFFIACDQGISVVNKGGTVPLRIGAAAEAGATRRLAAQALADGAKHADVHRMVKDLGYNVSNPIKQPTFDSVDSAMRVLEAFDKEQTERFNVGEGHLKQQFKGVEEMWAHLGFNMSDPKATPAAPDMSGQSERFLKVIEPALSEQDKARVEAAIAPKPVQKWQQLLGGKRCA